MVTVRTYDGRTTSTQSHLLHIKHPSQLCTSGYLMLDTDLKGAINVLNVIIVPWYSILIVKISKEYRSTYTAPSQNHNHKAHAF